MISGHYQDLHYDIWTVSRFALRYLNCYQNLHYAIWIIKILNMISGQYQDLHCDNWIVIKFFIMISELYQELDCCQHFILISGLYQGLHDALLQCNLTVASCPRHTEKMRHYYHLSHSSDNRATSPTSIFKNSIITCISVV